MQGPRITCLIWLQAIFVDFCISKQMQRFLLRDVCDHDYGVKISSYLAASFLGCVSLCETEEHCASAIFESGTKTCIINKQTSQYIGSTNACSSLVKYVAKMKVTCINNADCTIPSSSECVDDVCQCSAGYSYSPTEGTCTPFCTTYGSTYRMFQDEGLWGLDHFTTVGISHKECLQRCSSDTHSFTCRSVDYNAARLICCLSSATFYTHPGSRIIEPPWLHAHRNCA